MLLLDTCALIWWTLDPKKLSSKALEACQKMERSEGIISSISIWEIGVKIKGKKLDIGMTIEKYTELLYMLGYLKIIPVDDEIWIRNLSLNWKHSDPADRTIVATAMIHRARIITADENIKNFFDKHIW
jgi:PIN domain nuclease of toxin-antitoxin system